MREAVAALIVVATLVMAGLAASPFAFLAASVYPPAAAAIPPIVAVFVAAGIWVLRGFLRGDEVIEDDVETEVIDRAAIADCLPPAPVPHTFSAGFWLRARGRARRVKEVAR